MGSGLNDVRVLLLALLPAFTFAPAAAADSDGDVMFEKALAECPGAAKFILEGHDSVEAINASKQSEAAQQKAARPVTLPDVRDELLRMSGEDQAARNAWMLQDDETTSKRLEEVDRRNLPRIKRIIEQHGVLTPEMVGQDGKQAAWLLVQHSDRDPAFQMKVLESLIAAKQINGQELALLTDRVLRAQHKPQRYGSQFMPDEGGRQMPQPIEEPVDKVDERRAQLGLMPLADYGCMIEATSKPPRP